MPIDPGTMDSGVWRIDDLVTKYLLLLSSYKLIHWLISWLLVTQRFTFPPGPLPPPDLPVFEAPYWLDDRLQVWLNSLLVHLIKKTVFRIRVFFLIRIGLFSWVRIRIGQNSGSGSMKKCPKTVKRSKKGLQIYHSQVSTLSFLVSFLQNLIKTYLDPISWLTDGSASGFLS